MSSFKPLAAIVLFGYGAVYPALAAAYPALDDGQDRQAPVAAFSMPTSGVSVTQIPGGPGVVAPNSTVVDSITGNEYSSYPQQPGASFLLNT
jgi:hypothetical protein